MARNENTRTTDTGTEFSLSDIFWRLWDARAIIVIVPVILAGLAVLYVAIAAVSQSRQVTYLVTLRNIENQRYPNGTEFAPQDLLVPEVLAELGQQFSLPADAKLREAISVSYDSPIAEGIAKSYQDRLAARNLTQAEIEALNQSYLAELQAAMRTSLRINVNVSEIDVDVNTGLAMASALPDIWTRVYTTKFRIFVDRRVADLSVTQTAEDLSSTGSILVANARMMAMEEGLNLIIDDNRLAQLQSSEGRSAADLALELRRFGTVWFNPLKSFSLGGGDAVGNSYVSELTLDIAEKQRRVEAYDATLEELKSYQQAGQVPPQIGEPPYQPGERQTGVQIGETAFTEIVDLAQQASFANFIQETLRSRRQTMFEISDLTRELDSITREGESTVVTAEFRDLAAEQLSLLTAEYVSLIDRAQVALRDRAGSLYSPLLGPIAGAALLSLRNLLIVAVAGFAGFLFTVIGVLLWSSVRGGRRQVT